MSKWAINFSGYVFVEAETEEEANDAFWDMFFRNKLCDKAEFEIDYIDKEEED